MGGDGNFSLGEQFVILQQTKMAMENHKFKLGDTSSHGCLSIVISFLHVITVMCSVQKNVTFFKFNIPQIGIFERRYIFQSIVFSYLY